MRNKAVLIIPYFGNIPDYFNLWLKSAEANCEFNFYIYTDLALKVNKNSNVKIKYMTFDFIKQKIKRMFGNSVKINSPYKLCDYKPAYGDIFYDDIKEFDFWGFCDIDLIFGYLSHFITDDIMDKNEKVFYHGHFSLFKNTPTMNRLYLRKYNGVCDYNIAFHTNYCCHFDEDGTVAYAPKYDNISLYFDWLFYDVPCCSYEFTTLAGDTERYVVWDNGKLFVRDVTGLNYEVMYVHLQKRKMLGWQNITDDCEHFYILRNYFIVCKKDELIFRLNSVDVEQRKIFMDRYHKLRRKQVFNNIMSGAIKMRINRLLFKIQN